jgi:hemerythrin-like domain-containing protein
MGRCHPTESLRDEHGLILRVVDALEACLDRGRDAGAEEAVGEFVDFFRLYTDALHHGKEEGVLFEAMAEQGFTPATGPIAHMLEEHRLGRALVRRMGDAASALPDDPGAWRDVEHAARAYIDLIRQHILKEDHGVFDLADQALDDSACRRVCDAYDEICAGRFEGRSLQDLERVGADIIRRYAR